ncbi:MAG: aspartate ammonia-lyase [Ignavibacteriales bacterium]|nr:aspartate ammonia-lyase [Ignavibacteriales bacterium]
MKMRTERDSLGERKIPADAYYGVQTDRALENFPISGLKAAASYVEATVQIKRAAAIVNRDLDLLDKVVADAIVKAADEVIRGKLREWFRVDVFQAGAGTSHNMNANEVLANRAIEILGGEKGDYTRVHPNDHVNMSQSTNDVCPTAIRIAVLLELESFLPALENLEKQFLAKGKEFDSVVKSGRTHLMDAVPVRLGQEFSAYGVNLRKHREAVVKAADSCSELGIGGTAAGTGLNSHPRYRQAMVEEIGRNMGMSFRTADDYFEAMQSLRPMVEVSQAMRNLAQDLVRIANDIRLLGSGPKTGLAELQLPAVQPGSSIMPGKVNPSIAEMVNMVCFQVIGCDTTILMAAQAGQLELNVMMPVVAHDLIHEIAILKQAMRVFDERCIKGLRADVQRCQEYAENSVSIVTVLNPRIGYQAGAEIAKEYLSSGKSIRELVRSKGLLDDRELESVFDLRKMTEPGIHKK